MTPTRCPACAHTLPYHALTCSWPAPIAPAGPAPQGDTLRAASPVAGASAGPRTRDALRVPVLASSDVTTFHMASCEECGWTGSFCATKQEARDECAQHDALMHDDAERQAFA